MSQSSLSDNNLFDLTENDFDLIKTFKLCMKLDDLDRFNSDLFRRYRLHIKLYNKRNGIGAFFARLVKNGKAKRVGTVPSRLGSNHGRRIGVYKWLK